MIDDQQERSEPATVERLPASDCSEGLDCPHCDNLGWYIVTVGDQPMQEQCRWCYETPNSKFFLSQNMGDI